MKLIYSLFFVLLAFFLVTGCAAVSKNHGSLIRTDEVKDMFESAGILADHTYYYTGPEAQPDAIIALHNSFTFENARGFWIRVDISENMLQSWNRIIDNHYRIRYPYYGSRIMTPDGRQAGIWYSKYNHTVIKFPDADTIVIYAPGLSPKVSFRANRVNPRY